MKIGITGHQELDDPIWVKQEILRALHSQNTFLVGVTSLAIGADQLFAQAVLECQGELHIIVPCQDYIHSFKPEARSEYNRLLSTATNKEILSFASCDEKAYFSAGKRVVNLSELVIVVWNGKPAAGLGGTADIVEYAKTQGKRYFHINPTTQKSDYSKE